MLMVMPKVLPLAAPPVPVAVSVSGAAGWDGSWARTRTEQGTSSRAARSSEKDTDVKEVFMATPSEMVARRNRTTKVGWGQNGMWRGFVGVIPEHISQNAMWKMVGRPAGGVPRLRR